MLSNNPNHCCSSPPLLTRITLPCRLNGNIINTYKSVSNNWESKTLYYWQVLVIIVIVVFAVSLGLLLLYTASVLLNWGCGLGALLLVETVMAALFFLVAVGLAFLLKGLFDG